MPYSMLLLHPFLWTLANFHAVGYNLWKENLHLSSNVVNTSLGIFNKLALKKEKGISWKVDGKLSLCKYSDEWVGFFTIISVYLHPEKYVKG